MHVSFYRSVFTNHIVSKGPSVFFKTETNEILSPNEQTKMLKTKYRIIYCLVRISKGREE